MGNESKVYNLPTESLPTLGISHQIEDLAAIADLIESRGISTKNTRIERYAQYLKSAAEGQQNEARIFKKSLDARFRHPIDCYLYTLREVNELTWILRGLKAHIPVGTDDKLKTLVSGSDFSALDTNSQSRNIQFEFRIGSYFCQAGCNVDLSDTDIIATSENYSFYLECHRVAKLKQLQWRLGRA